MNKKSNKVPSAGTKAEKSTKDETRLPSSPTIGNTHVVRSPNVVSTINEIVIIKTYKPQGWSSAIIYEMPKVDKTLFRLFPKEMYSLSHLKNQ